jgi:hypothetical protein
MGGRASGSGVRAVHDDDVRASGQDEPTGGEATAAGSVMHLLAEHVPLTLLADLAVAEPRSEAILEDEGLPEEAWWEPDDAPGDPDAAQDPAGS